MNSAADLGRVFIVLDVTALASTLLRSVFPVLKVVILSPCYLLLLLFTIGLLISATCRRLRRLGQKMNRYSFSRALFDFRRIQSAHF